MAGAAPDPTVCAPSDRALIEQAAGLSLSDADPKLLDFVVEKSKAAGSQAFKAKKYAEAVRHYSQAIAGRESDATLYSNRSAAYLRQGLYEQALWDAEKSASLSPDWAKAHYRLGCARRALCQLEGALASFRRSLELEPASSESSAQAEELRAVLDGQLAARSAQTAMERRSLALKLREARREDVKEGMLRQIKQSMVAPDWELEDLDWRPTYLPSMCSRPLDAAKELRDPKTAALAAYLSALADLAAPKAALRCVGDERRWAAYAPAVRAALESCCERQDSPVVLTLEAGGGVLPLVVGREMAALRARRSAFAPSAGSSAPPPAVFSVSRGRMLYRMAKQVARDNAELAAQVRLLDCNLSKVSVVEPDDGAALREKEVGQVEGVEQADGVEHAEGTEQAKKAEQAEGVEQASGPSGPSGPEPAASPGTDTLPRRADCLVTDCLDHSVLGLGLLPALDDAAARLLEPRARIIPSVVRVRAALVQLSVGKVSGFNLEGMNAYRWYPAAEAVKMSTVPWVRLSGEFEALGLDLQARADAVPRVGREDEAAGRVEEKGENRAEKRNGEEEAETLPLASPAWEQDHVVEVAVQRPGRCNAVVFWFEADLAPGLAWRSWEGADDAASRGQESESWSLYGVDQAVQYLDGFEVHAGETLQLRVCQDKGRIFFERRGRPCTRARHALAPRWHFDMVLDERRNGAYDKAIRRAVQARKAAGKSTFALDMGAGSSILSMMAARAGAEEVVGAEVSAHMCDVGEETAIRNGFLERVTMLCRDVRRLDVSARPDGTPPDLERPADLLVFEVFDCGLLGEGVLHMLAAARLRFARPDAVMVPCAARVYAQPLQLRLGAVAGGLQAGAANCWRWRPDYEGVELGRCRDAWVPLADPREMLTFDFYDALENMRPVEKRVEFECSQEGVCNAMATWFELQLDEDTFLSTSPHRGDKGLTWPQALHWLPETVLRQGDVLQAAVKHDSYAVSYELTGLREADSAEPGVESFSTIPPEALLQARASGVPLKDALWERMFDSLQGVNAQLVRACVQNPLEFRATALAAIKFATRPQDFGLDLPQCVDFCAKIMA